MHIGLTGVFVVLSLCQVVRADGRAGLVAHWGFQKGSGDVVQDVAGGNHGEILGATWVKAGKGRALWFNGLSDYVDCGKGAALDLRKHVTVEAWVMPEDVPDGEPSIAGKGIYSYGLTYFENGMCYWYISSGANHLNADLAVGSWHHVVGTYDGQRMALYVDGKQAASRPLSVPIKAGGAFLMGACAGRKGRFSGAIADVRVYDRALSAEEIAAHFKETSMGKIQRPKPAQEVVALKGDGYSVGITDKGSLRVHAGEETYDLDTMFSCPGDVIGWNVLGQRQGRKETAWQPIVTKRSEREVEVAASGKSDTLKRTFLLDGHKLNIKDTLTNTTNSPVGVIVENTIRRRGMVHIVLGGANVSPRTLTAENPTVFASQEASSLGVIAEDSVFRLQFEARLSRTHVRFGARHLGLDKGTSYTLRWAVYPFDRKADYFDFVNSVRRDWKTNFTIVGPWDFFNIMDPLLDDHDRLKAVLKRKKVRIAALTPWVFYYDGAALPRAEHKAMLQKAIRALKKAAPDIKCIGCTENNIVSFDRAKLKQNKLFDAVCRGSGRYPLVLSAELTRALEGSSPWRDSLVKTPDGRAMIEDCLPKSFVHQMVYSEPDNYQARHLMDAVKFLVDEVGTDGVYIDQFNLAFEPRQRYHYAKWDGFTVDINAETGRIDRKYTDGGLVGAKVRKSLCEYVVSKGKIFVANTHAAVEETQALPVFRFMEAGWASKRASWKKGDAPPLLAGLCKGHFDSPIGLGVRADQIELELLNVLGRDDGSSQLPHTGVDAVNGLVTGADLLDDLSRGVDRGPGAVGQRDHPTAATDSDHVVDRQ